MKSSPRRLLILVSLAALMLLLSWQYWRVRDQWHLLRYALLHEDQRVDKREAIDQVLGTFELVGYQSLPLDYRASTQSNQAPFFGMLSHKKYYILPGNAIYQKIVGDVRIKDFLPKDALYKAHTRHNSQSSIYWLMDRRVLHKLHALQLALAERGYDPDAMRIVNGYRHPAYNQAVGGASRSRHIVGEAIDILVKDINQDGSITAADKDIVLKLLDQHIIRNQGGIGRYPGTMSVHFDVRGRRARWDRY